MRIFFNVWAPAALAPTLVITVNAIRMRRTNFMRKTFPLVIYDCGESFPQLLERLLDQRIVQIIAHRWNLLSLIGAFFGSKLHGLVERNLTDQTVAWKRLKILHEVFVIFFSAFTSRFEDPRMYGESLFF